MHIYVARQTLFVEIMYKKLVVTFVVALIVLSTSTHPVYSEFDNVKNRDIEQVIFIHYVKGNAKPQEKETSYFKLIGARWKSFPITLEVNPSGSGLKEEFVIEAIRLAAEEWDSGMYSQLLGYQWYGVSPNLFMDNIFLTSKGYNDLAWTADKLDGYNTLVWGNYPTPGVIAVTLIWFDRATKTIIEFDVVFDTDFMWGDAIQMQGVMDLQNIATHELGHAIGLADVYQTTAFRETMYGYSYVGDISKRDLYKGDMAGVTKLYGSANP